jgi:hypothetical protein
MELPMNLHRESTQENIANHAVINIAQIILVYALGIDNKIFPNRSRLPSLWISVLHQNMSVTRLTVIDITMSVELELLPYKRTSSQIMGGHFRLTMILRIEKAP